jgi:hypothetical protein
MIETKTKWPSPLNCMDSFDLKGVDDDKEFYRE